MQIPDSKRDVMITYTDRKPGDKQAIGWWSGPDSVWLYNRAVVGLKRYAFPIGAHLVTDWRELTDNEQARIQAAVSDDEREQTNRERHVAAARHAYNGRH